MFYKLLAALTILKWDMQKELTSGIPFLGQENYEYNSNMESSGLGNILQHARDSIGQVGSVAMTVLGVIMIIVGAFKIAKGLMNHGKEQTSWVINILLIVIGGVLLVGGLGFFVKAGREAQNTVNGWASNK